MDRRKIITIDAEKCTGCGECIPNCPEGALQIIDGKARLVSDLFCDGLGACIGHCPEEAITIEEREAEPYDERKVMENIVPQGLNTIRAHLKHLKDHGAEGYYREAVDYLKEHPGEIAAVLRSGANGPVNVAPPAGGPAHPSPKLRRASHEALANESAGGKIPCACPGSRVMDFSDEDKKEAARAEEETTASGSRPPRLRQWPVQLMLVPPTAPYLKDADLVIAADCVPFAYADFHEDFLKGRALLIGCPKLDDVEFYEKKLTTILERNNIRSVTCVHMEVPCCFGLVNVVKSAIEASGKVVPFAEVTVGVKGGILSHA